KRFASCNSRCSASCRNSQKREQFDVAAFICSSFAGRWMRCAHAAATTGTQGHRQYNDLYSFRSWRNEKDSQSLGYLMNSKSILIAGGAGGLGQEIVAALCKFDCSLMLVQRSESEKTELLRNRLKGSNCQLTFYECDFSSADEINDAIDIFFE